MSFPLSPKPLESHTFHALAMNHCQSFQNAFKTPSKHLPNAFQELPDTSKPFQKFSGLGDPEGWRAGQAMGRAAPVGFVASDGAARTFRRDGNRA
jgi:hypothetical protein